MSWYTRHKTGDPVAKQWTQEYWAGSPPSKQASYSKSYSWTPLETFGVDVPDFHRKRKAGQLIEHTQFLQREIDHTITPGNYYQKVGGSDLEHRNYSYVHANNLMVGGLGSAADTSYSQSLVQSAAARIVNAGWDAGTFASEFPSLKRQFKRVARTAKRLHHGSYNARVKKWSKRNLKSDISDFEKLWLEGRYGWRTLAYDIRDLNDAVTEFDAKRRIYTERVGSSYSSVTSSAGVDTWGAGKMHVLTIETTEHSVRGSVAAEIKPARFIVDPLQTGWEVIPYSFVIDWVINVGEALAANKLRYLASAYTASTGLKSSTTKTVTVTTEPNPGNVMTFSESYTGVYKVTQRSPTQISINPTFTGRKLSSDLLLDLRALAKGLGDPRRR